MPSKSCRPWNPTQALVLRPSPTEWLPSGHLTFFILDVVGELDVSLIEAAIQGKDSRGVRPYDPRMMVALLLYAYCTGTFSSRRIARATYEDVAYRVVTRGVLMLCHRAGLVKLGHVAIDGTKIQGNASKHKEMSYGRMQETEARLEREVEGLLERAAAQDADEDQRFGERAGDEDLPAELQRRSERLERIRAAKSSLEAEARKAARRAEPSTRSERRSSKVFGQIKEARGFRRFLMRGRSKVALE